MGRLETVLKPFELNKDWVEPRVAEGIEQNRKANAEIEVVDRDGNPVSGVTVHYDLKKLTPPAFISFS